MISEILSASSLCFSCCARSAAACFWRSASCAAKACRAFSTALLAAGGDGGTGVGSGVALPHARIDGIDRVYAAFARLETPLDWDDLILAPRILHQIGEIIAWIDMGEDIRANPAFGRVLQPGFRSLFYGPPGTGKTLTASLIGKKTGHDVYRVDLSMIVSKWIGETEKNLANVFDRAEGNGWILFFDEADAIFGKRSDVNQANDRYANQEVSYLLQRVEQFDGVVLLASNLRGNIDPAFGRRFQSMIHFALPNAAERLRLWTSIFSDPALIGADVDFAQLAEAHELTGGAIVNVLRAAILSARRGGHAKMSRKDIDAGIRRELNKDGRVSGGKR